eukprot:4401765-Prymnesium_polylepis.1
MLSVLDGNRQAARRRHWRPLRATLLEKVRRCLCHVAHSAPQRDRLVPRRAPALHRAQPLDRLRQEMHEHGHWVLPPFAQWAVDALVDGSRIQAEREHHAPRQPRRSRGVRAAKVFERAPRGMALVYNAIRPHLGATGGLGLASAPVQHVLERSSILSLTVPCLAISLSMLATPPSLAQAARPT